MFAKKAKPMRGYIRDTVFADRAEHSGVRYEHTCNNERADRNISGTYDLRRCRVYFLQPDICNNKCNKIQQKNGPDLHCKQNFNAFHSAVFHVFLAKRNAECIWNRKYAKKYEYHYGNGCISPALVYGYLYDMERQQNDPPREKPKHISGN